MRSARRWTVAGAVALVAGAAVLAGWALRPGHDPARAAAPPPPVPVVLSLPSTPETLSPTPTPETSSPTPPPVPHDAVAPAAPTHFLLTGPGFRVDASVCGMPFVRPLDPPGDQLHTVCWVQSGFGVPPGSSAAGTTYVLGHAWAEEQLVLNPISEFATAHVQSEPVTEAGVPTYPVPALAGTQITLTTANGTLTYAVDRAFLVAKEQAGNVPSVMATTVPNRVVLITCAVRNGVDVDQNVIAYATLVSAQRSAEASA